MRDSRLVNLSHNGQTKEVPADSLEGRADGPTNVISLESDMAATLVWSGPGAGGDATASAILADVIAIARDMR